MNRIHVIPVGDTKLHSAQAQCWCFPTETEPALWVHNAQDCREAKERATGQRCSEGWINIAEVYPTSELEEAWAETKRLEGVVDSDKRWFSALLKLCAERGIEVSSADLIAHAPSSGAPRSLLRPMTPLDQLYLPSCLPN